MVVFLETDEDRSVREGSAGYIERHRYYRSAGIEASQRYVVRIELGNALERFAPPRRRWNLYNRGPVYPGLGRSPWPKSNTRWRRSAVTFPSFGPKGLWKRFPLPSRLTPG